MSDASQAIDDAIERSWEKDRTVTCFELRDNILSALAESGLAIVPVEPTEAMITAGIYADQNIGVEGVWRHMLRAAQETGT